MPTKKSTYQKIKDSGYGTAVKLGSSGYGLYELGQALQHMGLFKDGGRVKGVGKATHGHGKAMKKGKK
jgi:hypothetical protein|tara:strand:+ start:33 stop:236 length:204 start_codon:yes stop_codon:yes gene_type:complete